MHKILCYIIHEPNDVTVFKHNFIYIYRKREREKERESEESPMMVKKDKS